MQWPVNSNLISRELPEARRPAEPRLAWDDYVDKLVGNPFDVERPITQGRDNSELMALVLANPRDQLLAPDLLARALPDCPGAKVYGPIYFADGRNVNAGKNLTVYPECDFGDNVAIVLGDNVTIGSNVSISTIIHPLDPTQRVANMAICQQVTIGRNVTIGSGSVVLPGVTIGNNVAIGSNSVVSRDIPDNTVVSGKPARSLAVSFAELMEDRTLYTGLIQLNVPSSSFTPTPHTALLLKFINQVSMSGSLRHGLMERLIGESNANRALIIKPFFCENGSNIKFSGSNILVNNGCVFRDSDSTRPISVQRGCYLGPRVTLNAGAEIEPFSWLGANVKIGENVRIGIGSTVAANSSVPPGTIIPPHSLVVGDTGAVLRRIGEPRDFFSLPVDLAKVVFERSYKRNLFFGDHGHQYIAPQANG